MRKLAIGAVGALVLIAAAPIAAQSANGAMGGSTSNAQGAAHAQGTPSPLQQGSTNSAPGSNASGNYNASSDVGSDMNAASDSGTMMHGPAKSKHKRHRSSTTMPTDTSGMNTGATTTTP